MGSIADGRRGEDQGAGGAVARIACGVGAEGSDGRAAAVIIGAAMHQERAVDDVTRSVDQADAIRTRYVREVEAYPAIRVGGDVAEIAYMSCLIELPAVRHAIRIKVRPRRKAVVVSRVVCVHVKAMQRIRREALQRHRDADRIIPQILHESHSSCHRPKLSLAHHRRIADPHICDGRWVVAAQRAGSVPTVRGHSHTDANADYYHSSHAYPAYQLPPSA